MCWMLLLRKDGRLFRFLLKTTLGRPSFGTLRERNQRSSQVLFVNGVQS